MNRAEDIRDNIREHRRVLRSLAAGLDEALAESERLALGQSLDDFPFGWLGALLIPLGAFHHALRQHLAAQRPPPRGKVARSGQRRRSKNALPEVGELGASEIPMPQ
jgi:hypothetical protein